VNSLVNPNPSTVFYEDESVYACLAEYPITKGHSLVVWKKPVTDLHLLNPLEYKHLMQIVDKIRNVLMKALNVEKVYLMYMDEIKHVHWHLIPRYNKLGFNLLKHAPQKIKDYKLAEDLKIILDNLKDA
jgi:diadenosine tetraphosphate (Ap4A) HIT family hydrolase